MNRPPLALLLAGLPGLPGPWSQEGAADTPDRAPELERSLAEAVDRATPDERRAAALALAARSEIPLEAWLAAARSFGRFEPAEPGVLHESVQLAPEDPVPSELWILVPRTYDPGRPAPLLVALHGTGGDGRGALEPWRGLADELGMLVLAPSDPGTEEGYAFEERERAAVLAALRWTRRHYDVDENRIHLSGVSRGGHLAWDLALRHPDLFASLAPMIGGPRVENTAGRNNLRYLENLAGTAIVDLQGAQDDPRLVRDVHLAFERLARWNAPEARLLEFPELEHEFDRGAVDWQAFLGAAVRDPHRERVVRCVARPGEGRAAWVEVLETGAEVAETFEPRVSAAVWNRLSDDQKHAKFQDLIDERTGRLEVERTAPGSYRAKASGIERFRLLLTSEDLPARPPLRVRLGPKTLRPPAEPDPRVLLLEFVERFDRTFLPVAEVRVP